MVSFPAVRTIPQVRVTPGGGRLDIPTGAVPHWYFGQTLRPHNFLQPSLVGVLGTTMPELELQACVNRGASSSPYDAGEKYVFLVRHAQSRWNVLNESLKGMNLITAMTSFGEVADADHGLSDVGKDQACEMRERIRRMEDGNSVVEQSNQKERFYAAFARCKQAPILSSPMRRAVQTANAVFPSEDGWSTIRLLRSAKELRNHFWEIDCGSNEDNIGDAIAENAELGEDACRVDAEQCKDMWWSTAGESLEEQDEQVKELWETLLSEEGSHVLVSHSNLIRRLAAHLVEGDSVDLAIARSTKLQNCNILGLRLTPSSNPASDDIWQKYEVSDTCLMFGSGFEDQ